jgi:predicted ATPase/class 3 adenylate cyclase
MAALPTGTVTFLFTDIEGSTRMWEREPSAMRETLARHEEILQSNIQDCGGYVFKTVGDGLCTAFATAPDALRAAIAGQRGLLDEDWGSVGSVRVRMALHTGISEEREGDYFGPTTNRVTRLLSAGHGGQILMSQATRELVRDSLRPGEELRWMGERRFKDLLRPEHVYQLVSTGLLSSFPPLRTLNVHVNSLPEQPTRLVGRARETTEVRELLRREEVRLLTLTGPGGTGKTRLGLQVAADMIDEYGNGVFFVALAAINDPAIAISTILQDLGVMETGDQTPVKRLKEYLRVKELLLVLDNFEQIIDAGPLVSDLLAACPRLKVLVTSRAALHLYGEHQYEVPPLELPESNGCSSIERLRECEAVKLFVERARAAKADFVLAKEDVSAVAEICARLDGLPLAIELAAARVKLLNPRTMLRHVGNRLKLLSGDVRDLPARQRTLRNAIDWSHDLLENDEQTLFRRMSMFAGGCTLEAVEQICAIERGADALSGVESLLDKSLLRREPGLGVNPRFVMLETIREYARERLEESGEYPNIARMHADTFLALAEDAEPELVGPRQVEWMDLLETEHDNIRAALSWSLENGVEQALRLGGALGWFWYARGYRSEGCEWLEAGLAKDGAVSIRVRAKALLELGNLLAVQGDLRRAVGSLDESLALHREMEDRIGVVYSLSYLAFAYSLQGDLERMSDLLSESLALARESGEPRAIGFVLNDQAALEMLLSHYARAKTLLEESLTLMREAGDKQGIGAAYGNLGLTALYQGDYERAEASLAQAQVFLEEVGDGGQSWVQVGNRGLAALLRGDLETAMDLSKESLKTFREMVFKQGAIECLEVLACAAGALGDAQRAAWLVGASEFQREHIGIPMPDIDREMIQPYLNDARSRLGETLWEAAREEGRAMSVEEATEYALNEASR